MNDNPDYILDLRGAISPITLLKINQVFRDMKCKQVLEILCQDPETHKDIFKVLPSFSFELIDMEKQNEELAFRVQVKKLTDF